MVDTGGRIHKKMKNIKIVITFKQSENPRFLDYWNIRYLYADGYKEVFKVDECNKRTAFGQKPDMERVKEYAQGQAEIVAHALGIEPEIVFA